MNERIKRQYNQRCIQLEHTSFTPLIFSAYGGCSRENYHFLNKKSILPAVAMNWLRKKPALPRCELQFLAFEVPVTRGIDIVLIQLTLH